MIVALLFEETRSREKELSAVIFVKSAISVGLTTIVIVAAVPLLSVPRSHVTTPLDQKHSPKVELAETNATPGGTASRSVTAWASFGPLLVT